jgi:tetratricopeptide (TPR) repeat protein
MNDINEALKRAMALAKAGHALEALTALDSETTKALANGDTRGASRLLRHAGALATGASDLARAVKYYEESARHAPDDAWVHFALGDAHRRLAHLAEAGIAFERSHDLAISQGDTELATMASKALTAIADEGADPS